MVDEDKDFFFKYEFSPSKATTIFKGNGKSFKIILETKN